MALFTDEDIRSFQAYRAAPAAAPSAAANGGAIPEMIRRVASEEGVGQYADLLVGLAQTESGLDPRAQNGQSSAGGLFQFIDDTARRYGITDKYDAEQNARAAARMFRDHLEQFGDVNAALAAHHVGAGKVRAALSDRGVGDVNISTQDWLARVWRNAGATAPEAPAARGFSPWDSAPHLIASGAREADEAAARERARQAASDDSPMMTNLRRGWRQMTDNVANTRDLLAGDYDAIAARLHEWQAFDLENPQPAKTRKFFEDWMAEEHGKALTNPSGLFGAMVEQISNSLPSMMGSIPGMLVGAKAGAALGPLGMLVGSAVGAGVGSAPGSIAIESGARIAEMMHRDGVQFDDQAAIVEWLRENRGAVLEEGVKKGGTVAAFDGLAAGVGSRLIMGPVLKFTRAEHEVLRRMGVDPASGAAAAARQSQAYQIAMAPFRAELAKASTKAQLFARGFGSFMAESMGEGAGEYFGEVAATGEGDLNEAMLEATLGAGQSLITTGAQFAGKSMVGSLRAQPHETPEQETAPPPPPPPTPNAPLTSAAAQAAHAAQTLPPTPHANNAPVQPGMDVVPAGEAQAEPSEFDQRLARVASFVEDRTFLQSLRGATEYGPESVTELLSAFVRARNPNVDDLVRERALADLEQFIDAFASRPNFTFGQAEPVATEPGTAMTAPHETAVAPQPVRDDGMTLEGEAREVGTLPRQMLAAPDSIEAAEQMREAAEIAHERALLDLREAEQAGAPNIEAYRQAAEQAAAQREGIAAQLAEMQRTLEQTQRLQAEQERRVQFEALTRDVPPADAASRIAEVKRLVADGWRVEGKALVSPHGEQRSLNPVELAAAREAVRKAQAAEQSSPAGERIAGPTPEQSGVSSATQTPTAPEQSRPAPGQRSEPAQILSGSGSYPDGTGWVVSYDALPRSDGSTLLTRTFKDEDGERTEYLTLDGTWEKGKPSTVVVSGGGFVTVGGLESFPSVGYALKAAQDDLAGMGGRRSEPAQLPDGWAESVPGGLATNPDPEFGGIVDQEIVSGKWFAIPHKQGVPTQEGFASRAEALDALRSAVISDEPARPQQEIQNATRSAVPAEQPAAAPRQAEPTAGGATDRRQTREHAHAEAVAQPAAKASTLASAPQSNVERAVQRIIEATNGVGEVSELNGPENLDLRTEIVSDLTGRTVADLRADPRHKFLTSVREVEAKLFDALNIEGDSLRARREAYIEWLDGRSQAAHGADARQVAPVIDETEQPAVDPLDAELQDALAHLGDVLADIFPGNLKAMPGQYDAADLLPALSKVVGLLVKKGFRSFAASIGAASKAMRGNAATAPYVDQVSARQWKAAYNAIAEFHEGTDSEDAVNALSAEAVAKIVRAQAGATDAQKPLTQIFAEQNAEIDASNARHTERPVPQPTSSTPFAQIEEGRSALIIQGDPAAIKERLDAHGIKSMPRKTGVSVPNRKHWDTAREIIPVRIERYRVTGVPERLAEVSVDVLSNGTVRLVSPVEIAGGPNAEAVLTRYAKSYADAPADVQAEASPPAEPTHQDPGEPAEAATRPVIDEAIRESARNTEFNPTEARRRLLAEIDAAIAAVPTDNADLSAELAREEGAKFDEKAAERRFGRNSKAIDAARDAWEALQEDRIAKTASQIGFVTFDVPGDGKFKVVNTVDKLNAFKAKVKSSPGFAKNPTRPMSYGSGLAGGQSLDQSIAAAQQSGGDPLAEIGNAIEIARLKNGKDEDRLLDRFREASGGKEYDTWRAEQGAAEEIAAREAQQAETAVAAEPYDGAGADAVEGVLTPDAAVKRMEWRDQGQRDGEHRHTLVFKEDGNDRNGITVATLRKYGRGKWTLDDADLSGDIETFGGLREAKKAAQVRALRYLEREGFVRAESSSAQAEVRPEPAYVLRPQDEFVTAPDGSIDFGEITPEMAQAMRRQAGKIRLREGDETWGETHIAARHGAQFAALGFDSVRDFVARVAGSFNAIYKGEGAGLSLVLETGGTGGRLMVQLEPSEAGDFYDVKTASPIRADQYKNQKPLWERTGTSAPTTQGSPLLPVGRSGQTTVAQNEEAGKERSGVIDDFGEKLGGARKDREALQAMSREFSDDDLANLPLSKIWPADEIDKIEDPFTAAFAHAARAEIPPKPRKGYKLARWVEKVKTFRDLMSEMLGGVSREHLMERMTPVRAFDEFRAKVALLEAIDRKHWKRIDAVGEYPNAYDYDAAGKRIPAQYVSVQIDGRREIFEGVGSVADVLDQINEKLGEAAPDKKVQFEVRGRGNTWFINKKGDKEYRPLKTFQDAKEALAYVKSNHTDLVAAWEAVKERDNVRKTDVRGEENRDRVGRDWRGGRDVVPQQFIDDLGFRGVEFGLWVQQGKGDKERQGMLNQAYDALMDLADVAGVPPRAISLNGTLGLGFGSRGHGWASAHFEPDTLVINLTKTRGAGALAHEWFHALDNYFARYRGEPKFTGDQNAYRRDAFITYSPENYYVHKASGTRIPQRAFEVMIEGKRHPDYGSIFPRYRERNQWELKEGVRPEVGEAFADLVKALNASPMAQRASAIDKGKDGYWSRIIERGARAFESYVIAKMAQNGYQNDYLANVVPVKDFKRDPGRYPYLLENELAPVAEAFDSLFSTIESRETDQGVALFRTSDPNPAAAHRITHADADRMVRDFVAAFPGAPEIVVVARTDQLPQQVQRDASDQRAGNVKGVFNHRDGRVYVVSGNHRTRADLEATLLHEAIGHAGMRALFGPEFVQRLNQIFIALGGQAGLVRIMQRRGMNAQIQDYLRGVNAARNEETARRRQAVAEGKPLRSRLWTDAMAKAVLTEEVFAHIAESGNQSLRDRFLEIVGRIRQWLRDKGLAELASLGESDLLFLLSKARAEMQQGDSRVMRDGVETGERELVTADGRAVPKDDPDFANAMRLAHILGLEERAGATVFAYAGGRAETADAYALQGAQARIAAGEDAEAVRRDTGWHRGRDGKWRFEIDDSGAKLKKPFPSKGQRFGTTFDAIFAQRVSDGQVGLRVGDILEHPQLFAAYPALADLAVDTQPGRGASYSARTSIDPSTIRLGEDLQMVEVLSKLLHEIQHGIQRIEGFATGGSPDMFAQQMRTRRYDGVTNLLAAYERLTGETAHYEPSELANIEDVDAWLDQWTHAIPRQAMHRDLSADDAAFLNEMGYRFDAGRGTEWAAAIELLADDARRDIEAGQQGLSQHEQYRRLAGEVEARNVQARRKMSAAERRATPPSVTADTADADVIVMFNGREMASAPTPANAGNIGTMSERDRVASEQAPAPAGDGMTGGAIPPEKDGYVRLFHGGAPGLATIEDTGPFGGLFASKSSGSADSHGTGGRFFMDVAQGRILEQHMIDYDIAYDDQVSALRKAMPKLSDEDVETAYAAVLEDKSDQVDPDELMRIFREETVGEASWEAQRIRGKVAKLLGYQAVEMSDEHGTSYLVLPGVDVRPVNDSSAPAGSGAPAVFSSAAKQTETAAFKKWFGDSKVVDENGQPLVVYHGSINQGMTEIRPGMREPGAWFTRSLRYANDYAKGPEGGIYEAFLSIERPMVVTFDADGLPVVDGESLDFDNNVDIVRHAMKGGYDGVHFPDGNFSEESEAWVAFRPEQIKSATGNNGAFDPASPSIMAHRTESAPDDPGLTPDQFRTALVERFGEDGVASLERQGLLNVAEPNPADPTPAWYDTDTGRAYFAPSLMADADAAVRAVIHEIGEHHGLESALGPRAWRTLKARIATLAREGKNDIAAAWAGVLDTYPEFAESGYDTSYSAAVADDRFMHEVIAKIGETAAGRKSGLWRDLLAAVNRFLLKMGIGRQINKNELADLVAGSLKRVMRGQGTHGPRGGIVPEMAQRPFNLASYLPGAQPAVTPRGMSGPKIDNSWLNFAKLRGFFESAADRLRRTPGLEHVGRALARFYDQTRANRAAVAEPVLRAKETLDSLNKAEREQVLAAFEAHRRAIENGRRAEADQVAANAPAALQTLLDAWTEIADTSGEMARDAGVMVMDARTGQYRPMGNVANFWPRAFSEAVQRALDAPHKHPQQWNELLDAIVADGRAATPEEAAEYLRKYRVEMSENVADNDYFAGIEKGRAEPLPEVFYDYSWEAGLRYKERWADRLAQIQAFGQSYGHGPNKAKDLFEQTLERVQDDKTREYLARVRAHAYQERYNDPFMQAAQTMNTLATGLQLGNPATALLNLIGGTALTFQAYGVRRSFAALIETAREFKRHHKDAFRQGVLTDDYLQIAIDSERAGVPAWLQKGATLALKVGGYTPAEHFIRTHNMVVGKAFLREALHEFSNSPGGKKAAQFAKWMQQNGFNPDDLVRENGQGAETDRFIRYTINLTQGSYRIDQTPLFVDSTIGKFLFKYQKFGTQLSRMFWTNHLKPFVESINGGQQVDYEIGGVRYSARLRNFMPLVRFFAVASLAGLLVMDWREKLFGYQNKAPTWGEIDRALADDEFARGVALMAERAFQQALAVGALGFFGNYWQMGIDAADKQRVKNPIDPPALAPLKSMGNLVLDFFDQGNRLTGRNFDQFGQEVWSFYRTVKRAGSQAYDAAGVDLFYGWKELNVQAAKADVAFVKKMTRRYAADAGLEAKRRQPDRIAPTENTPFNNRVIDALLAGEVAQARLMVREHFADRNRFATEDERRRALLSLKGSVRARDPARVGIAPSEAERAAFLRWAKANTSAQEYARIRRIADQYQRSARLAGLL